MVNESTLRALPTSLRTLSTQNKDEDRLNALRDDLVVIDLKEDGMMVKCPLRWDSMGKSYSCDSKPSETVR